MSWRCVCVCVCVCTCVYLFTCMPVCLLLLMLWVNPAVEGQVLWASSFSFKWELFPLCQHKHTHTQTHTHTHTEVYAGRSRPVTTPGLMYPAEFTTLPWLPARCTPSIFISASSSPLFLLSLHLLPSSSPSILFSYSAHLTLLKSSFFFFLFFFIHLCSVLCTLFFTQDLFFNPITRIK